MNHFTLKHIVGSFLVGTIVGCLVSYFIFSGSDQPSTTQTIITPEQVREREKDINTFFNARIDSLETCNKALQQTIDSAKQQRKALQKKTSNRAAAIKKMIEPTGVPASSLLKTSTPDTSCTNCDSLKHEIAEYMEESELKDQAYEREIQYLNESVSNKDSVIVLLRFQQQEKDTLLSEVVNQLELATNVNQELKKKMKRKKFGNTLKTVGLMIATGATAFFIGSL